VLLKNNSTDAPETGKWLTSATAYGTKVVRINLMGRVFETVIERVIEAVIGA
jgi:hypothetical protein